MLKRVLRCSVILAVSGLLLGTSASLFAADQREYALNTVGLTLSGQQCGMLQTALGGKAFGEVICEPAGSDYVTKKHIGALKYSPIIMESEIPLAPSLCHWISDSWKMSGERIDGELAFYNYGTTTAKSRLQFYQALVAETRIPACDGGSEENGYIGATLVPEYTRDNTAATAEGKAQTGQPLSKKWRLCDFKFEIDGLESNAVSRIEPFTIKSGPVEDSIGDARDSVKQTGKLEFPDLKITLSESKCSKWKEWYDSFVIKGNNDDSQERSGSLIFLSQDLKTEIMRINLYNLGIVALDLNVTDSGRSSADLVARLYCERMELDASKAGTPNTAAPATNEVLPPDGKGVFGKTYSMRKGEPLYFNLHSANYSLTPVSIGQNYFTAAANEKLLVLNFLVTNPGTTKRLVRFDSLRISAIDQADQNRPQKSFWGQKATGDLAAYELAPGQIASLYAVITVPAKGEPSAIMVRSNRDNDGPDLIYDVHGNVPGLTEPFIDTTDPTGATVKEEVQAERYTSYPCDYFGVTVEKMVYTNNALAGLAAARGQRYLVCTLMVKNLTPVDHLMRHDMLQPELFTDEGERLVYKGMLLETSDRAVAQQVAPGEQMRVRMYFAVPNTVSAKRLIMQERKSRRYLYPVRTSAF